MTHIVQDVQQEYFMKQARCKMSANTAYVVNRSFGAVDSEREVIPIMERRACNGLGRVC